MSDVVWLAIMLPMIVGPWIGIGGWLLWLAWNDDAFRR